MKKIIVNIMATTCLAVLIIMTIGFFYSGSIIDLINGNIYLPSIVFFQVLLANIIIHVGLYFTRKFENKYTILEYLLDISLIIIVLLVFGLIFMWYPDSPWILVIIAVVIYILGLFTGIVRTRKEIDDINKLLQKRKEKSIENP